jgi:HlyD family secretion protein
VIKRTLAVVLVFAAVGAGARAYLVSLRADEPKLTTTPVTRGPITQTVAATGTLQAVTTVTIGSQVSGTVSWLGADFNSIVRKGQIIARLDPSLLQAAVDQARAGVTKALAQVEQDSVALKDAETKFARATELADRELIPPSDLDAARTAVDTCKATLQSAKAQEVQARATLHQAQVNLDHANIESPIDGIVIQRSVDVGQTVAASLQSPTMFVIAADLTKMQVNASIDEADIGQIRDGQPATFRVDAFPDVQFAGTVSQVRLQATIVQNVTTYNAIIDVQNRELQLRPGMTANVRIEVASRTEALRVPTAALRFRPSTELLAALDQPDTRGSSERSRNPASGGEVWTWQDGALRAVPVRVGLSDGANTEVLESALAPGIHVVTSASASDARTARTTASPLFGGAPQSRPRPTR